MRAEPWWQSEAAIAWALILFFPLGLYLMWRFAPWRNRFKWTWSVVFALVLLVFLGSAFAEEPESTENVASVGKTTPSPTAVVVKSDASPTSVASSATRPAAATTITQQPLGSSTPPLPIPTATEPAPNSYVVKSGDTLGAICSAQMPSMGATACSEAIVVLNALSGPDRLTIGQTLIMPPSVGVTTTAPSVTPVRSTSVPTPTTSVGGTTLVVRVIDGDTIELQGGARVRYIGIDTPESTTVQECFGQEATARNRQLVEEKTVTLEKDVSETDQYGRLLRYVYVGGVMVNQTLVSEGFAQVSTYPPDVKYQDVFLAAQRQARDANRGFWGGCIAALPPVTATPTPPVPVVPLVPQQPPTGCDPHYPTVCIPPYPPDLDCGEITFRNFQVIEPDPHNFDNNDADDIGCES